MSRYAPQLRKDFGIRGSSGASSPRHEAEGPLFFAPLPVLTLSRVFIVLRIKQGPAGDLSRPLHPVNWPIRPVVGRAVRVSRGPQPML
jgi:hypothetical protein